MRRILIPTLLGLALLSSTGIAAAAATGVQFTEPADWTTSSVDGLTRCPASRAHAPITRPTAGA